MQFLNNPPPQAHHEITWYLNYNGYEGEKADQDKTWGGVCCKGKGWRYGTKYKGGKNQKEEEIGGGMCLGYVEEEEIIIPI